MGAAAHRQESDSYHSGLGCSKASSVKDHPKEPVRVFDSWRGVCFLLLHVGFQLLLLLIYSHLAVLCKPSRNKHNT